MKTAEGSTSTNGRCSDTWHRPWTHFKVERRSSAYCRVTFDHPPMNMVTARTVAELAELVELIEQDEDLNVVVFASAKLDFYLADYAGPAGASRWNDALVRLARAPVVSIAAVRGRVCGAGREFVRACDLRFALDDEVEAAASWLSCLDHDAIARTKARGEEA